MDLEALCRAEPTAARWREIVEGLEALEGSDELSPDRIERLNGLLEHWPDELRATMCRLDWDERMIRGEADLRFRLFRYLKYDSVFVGRYTGMMMRSPSIPLGVIGQTSAPSTWKQLSMINFRGQSLTDEDIRALARADLPFLHTLYLDRVSAAGAIALGEASWLGQLKHFEVHSPAGDTLVQALARPMRALETLALGATAIERGDHFAEWNMPSLRQLGFNRTDLRGACAQLASWNHELEWLRLGECSLEPEHVAMLLGGHLRARKLELHKNPLGDAVMRVLGGHAFEEIVLRSAGISDEGLARLAQTRMPSLEALEVGPAMFEDTPQPKLTTRGLNALLDSETLEALESITFVGTVERVAGRRLGELRLLRIEAPDEDDFDDEYDEDFDEGLDAVRKTALPKLDGAGLGSGLQQLKELSAANVDDPRGLLDQPWIAGVERLFVSDTALDAHCLAAIARAHRLKWLVLDGCSIDGRALAALLESPARPDAVFLRGNPIGDEGVQRIAASEFCSSLERLGLGKCGITDAGAEVLASSELLKNTERLFLNGNPITKRGVDRLADRLTTGWMSISVDEQTAKLKAAPPRCCP